MVKLMFLCTGNSCRSQMAEGLARYYGKGLVEAYSAGLTPVGVNPYAKRVMAELGIDISGQSSKRIDPELAQQMDIVITLCGQDLCPRTPENVKRLHWPIDDPVGAVGTDEQIMDEFRRARDEIKDRILDLLREFEPQPGPVSM